MRYKELEPRFVTTVPRQLEPGVLYVSMEYGTVVHSCCCGCGEKVVTPLTPTDWSITFNGESVSLWPSIGSWNLPCQSHYVIKGNRVLESGRWNRQMIDAEISRDNEAKAKYYKRTVSNETEPSLAHPIDIETGSQTYARQSFWKTILSRLLR